jgi:type VI secretion system protein ImpM
MPCGLFGKLPAKRDFIAVNAPREFLAPWEEWLQGGMTAGRLAFDKRWLPAYLKAPLWRFWLGPAVCGIPVAGVFMSSADGVGRHFPLSVFCCGEAGERFLGPLDGGVLAWCNEAEEFLLDALEPGLDFDSYLERLKLLALPPREPQPPADDAFREVFGGRIVPAEADGSIDSAFAGLLREEARLRHGSTSYWWTVGGEEFPPVAISATGLPDRNLLGPMLTREFSTAPATDDGHGT